MPDCGVVGFGAKIRIAPLPPLLPCLFTVSPVLPAAPPCRSGTQPMANSLRYESKLLPDLASRPSPLPAAAAHSGGQPAAGVGVQGPQWAVAAAGEQEGAWAGCAALAARAGARAVCVLGMLWQQRLGKQLGQPSVDCKQPAALSVCCRSAPAAWLAR